MKQYDRITKKYVTEEEAEKLRISRDKKFCKGKKPHDYVLVLPYYVSYNENYTFKPELYYKIMDERCDFIESQKKELEKLGIQDRGWNSKQSRLYMCSVCKKHKYQDN